MRSVLEQLGRLLDGHHRALEYIQDYVGVYGLKMWHEEYSRVIAFTVEQECNRFVKKKMLPDASSFQSRTIPVPLFPPVSPVSAY